MENKITKSVYPGIDIGKFFCAFLILFYHYFSEHGSLPGLLEEALSLYAVAVALFMVISGFLLYNKLEGIYNREERWSIVKKQVLRIYRIYLLWSIPYLLFTILRWDWNSISAGFVLWKIQGWVFQSTFFTIWFMPMLAIGTLLTFWLTEKLPNAAVNVLAEALLIRKISGGHTGIDLTIMMIPTVFCILGFLISIRLPDGKYARWMRNMSILIFMSQRLFLTVLPQCFPVVFFFVFMNKYIGATAIILVTVLFSSLVIQISKKKAFFKNYINPIV